MIRRVKVLFSLEAKSILLLMEAFVYLGWARLKMCLPFAKLASWLGEPRQETAFAPLSSELATVRRVSEAIHLMSRYTPWESKCIVRAIAGMKMLERRGIESTLYLGTSKEDNNGALSAHAWLRSGSYYITGADVMKQYTVVAVFAKKMSR